MRSRAGNSICAASSPQDPELQHSVIAAAKDVPTFTCQTRSLLSVSVRCNRASPLVGSVITCFRKLLSILFRNLLDILFTAVLAFQQKMGYLGRPGPVVVRIILSRNDHPMLSNSEVAQSLFFRSRHVYKIFWVQDSVFVFDKNTMRVHLCIWDNKVLVV